MKKCLLGKMRLIHLKKGDDFKFKNFPKVDFFVMEAGRLRVQWYNVLDLEEGTETGCTETLFIRDHLDQEKIEELYENQSIVNTTGVCVSEKATIVQIDYISYSQHYRMSEYFNVLNIKQFIYTHTPELKDYGLAQKKKALRNFFGYHCSKGQILEVEGQVARCAYIVLKGRLNIYKKLLNDDLRDTNSRRREQRNINQGSTVADPMAQDKEFIEAGPKTPIINMDAE